MNDLLFGMVILLLRFVPTFVKKELNLLAISVLFVIILFPSIKNEGNDFFLLVLLNISLMVFQVAFVSFLNLVNIFS